MAKDKKASLKFKEKHHFLPMFANIREENEIFIKK
jgi:hypothetical protein